MEIDKPYLLSSFPRAVTTAAALPPFLKGPFRKQLEENFFELFSIGDVNDKVDGRVEGDKQIRQLCQRQNYNSCQFKNIDHQRQ